MASEVDVANDALTFLGASRITSLADEQTEAKVMTQLYDRTVDAVLRGYPWKCAKFQAELARSATAPVYAWDYSYRLPVDPFCLRVLHVKDADADDKWDRYGDYIYTDLAACKITYIGRIDASVFDSLLRDAVAARLAAEAAYPLVGSTTLQAAMTNIYAAKLEEAKEASAIEGSSTIFVSNYLETARK